jgi:hypothetical protein
MLNQYFKFIDKSEIKRQYFMPTYTWLIGALRAGEKYRSVKNEAARKLGDDYWVYYPRLKAWNIKA